MSSAEARLNWDFWRITVPDSLGSLTAWWSQGIWTSYMVVQGHQDKCFSKQDKGWMSFYDLAWEITYLEIKRIHSIMINYLHHISKLIVTQSINEGTQGSTAVTWNIVPLVRGWSPCPGIHLFEKTAQDSGWQMDNLERDWHIIRGEVQGHLSGNSA